ncbi:histidine phosphatase family protein [Sphingomonas sp. 2SG]|uniref:histidine phosphatase family protein n=1 Tax=Sphingomonas sp. 2SG TaxID=2502201 RepID=UPI0010F8EC9B|nr:histidine phosphatase family protein [Sphingomonas sp. 2SG]
MRATFVRHGQSTGNAGMPSDDLSLIELTDLGWQQARDVAAVWDETPSLIVTSPYLRTQQTAAPTIERFHSVPVEVWPIEEFTYLQPSQWNGTLSSTRMPYLERFWSAADPTYCDGEGAESFATLLRRAETALGRLSTLPPNALVYVFSHGQFIQAVRAVINDNHLDDKQKMKFFWKKGAPPPISNVQRLSFSFGSEGWNER